MKIAVAALDRERIAGTLAEARVVHVYPVADETVGGCESRELPGAHAHQPENGARNRHNGNGGNGLIHVHAEAPNPDTLMETGLVPESLLHAVLDCEIVIARRIGPVEELELRRLGILALPMNVPATPVEAVRMAVSGTPPERASGCGPCRRSTPLAEHAS